MQFSAAHRACVYTIDRPDQVTALIPQARQLTTDHVAVPANFDAMFAMRRLGYPVVAPILLDYDWPRYRGEVPQPFPQQYHMAAFHTMHHECFNLSDMRTGKTLSALWAADYLMSIGVMQKMLIVAPLSTLHSVWDNAIYKHFVGRRKAVVLHGDRAKRLRLLDEDADFYIINHDGLAIGKGTDSRGGLKLGDLAQRIRDRRDIDAITVDEGSIFRERTSERYKVLHRVRSGKQWCWWLTGTPTPNEPPNAWAQAHMVRTNYEEAYRSFHDRTMYRLTQFKWVPRQNAAQAAAEILQPSIRFDRHACLGTLPVKPEIREVELAPSQKKALAELKKDLQIQIGKGTVNAVNEAALRTKFIQISAGAVYGQDHEVIKTDCAPRLKVTSELIEQANGKVIIFAPLTGVVNMLYKELGAYRKVAKVIGATTPKQRFEIFKSFQDRADNTYDTIVADPRTVSHGLTLTEADTIIWYAPCDMPETFQQANCRIEGSSQRYEWAIYCLASTPVERECYRRLDGKETMQGAILQLAQGEIG